MHTLVIGGGTTGPSLAHYLTLAGHNTVLVSCLSEMLAGAEAAIKMGYRKLANTELLPTTAEGWCGRLTSFTNMVEAVQNFDIAFEAISEIAAQCSCKIRVAVTHFANPSHLIPVASVARYICPDLDSSETPEDLTSMNQDGNSGAETGRGFLRLDAGTQRSGDG